jgi:hypothetical protein
MASVASQLIEEVTAHAQRDSLEDVQEICADGTYFPNNLHTHISLLICLPLKRISHKARRFHGPMKFLTIYYASVRMGICN